MGEPCTSFRVILEWGEKEDRVGRAVSGGKEIGE